MILALALLAGCPKAPLEELPPPTLDPAQLLERATAEPPPGPSAATFDLKLKLPDDQISAQGALVVVPPDRFRIEVRGPIGPPQVVIVSDGTKLTAYLAGKNRVLIQEDADAALTELTGGKTGLEALASLLLGRLPPLGPPPYVKPGPTPAYRWQGPEQSYVEAALNPRTAHLAGLELAGLDGLPLLTATVEGGTWPERLGAVLPRQGVEATLTFEAWNPASPPPEAFVLTPPPGAEVLPLLPPEGAPPPAP